VPGVAQTPERREPRISGRESAPHTYDKAESTIAAIFNDIQASA
jgi:hypothetical protein